jgi:diaminohydroxyphosphoribosylaminopyrimidine deaminase/5-amino-6-(5-phosphoribosylamino)uracil reductase
MRDRHFMERALELAARGRGHVSPNPMVGAVVVDVEGRVVGEGWHRRLGGGHAEVEALKEAGGRASGATVYVTLEPCNHYGRTPPCTAALLDAGVARVVAATRDPNPRVAGAGLDALRAAGLEVASGVAEEAARRLNASFFTWALRGRPRVTLKTAISLDGRIACRTGHSQWITGPAARRRVHLERAEHDAILVGVGTILADDPRLDVRLDGEWRSPRRVILDSRGRTPPAARALPGALLYCTGAGRTDAEWVTVAADPEGRPRLDAVLADLGARSVTSLLVEGGGRVAASFLSAGLVDRLLAFVAPRVITGREAPGALGVPIAASRAEPPTVGAFMGGIRVERLEEDILIEGILQEVWT